MAAVLVRADELDAAREVLRGSLPSSIAHFRWTKENDRIREALLTAIQSLEPASIVVTTTPVARKRQERARGRCLERLSWEIAERSASAILLESRADQDAADRRVLAGLQRRGVIPPELTYGFGTKSDPALWMPDAIGGAVMARLCEDAEWFAPYLADVAVVHLGR